MLFVAVLALLAPPADWVPVRWSSADPGSLELLKGTSVNCLLLERPSWQPALLDRAATDGIAALGVIHPGDRTDVPRGLAGVVFEGDFSGALPEVNARVKIALAPRSRMRFDTAAPVIGTYQAVWPGIQVEPGGAVKAAPSGGPWIDTNTGFLRYARAASDAVIWIANTPPSASAIPTERYLQVISDAEIMGARWVVALDPDLNARLLKREPAAVAAWKTITDHLAWFEAHKQWRAFRPVGKLALVQDAASGALYSGGVLDMIAVKHTPVLAVPANKLTQPGMSQARIAVDVDPGALTPEQKEVLRQFARSGGTVFTGPPDWKFPPMTSSTITLSERDVKKLDEIWKQLNSMTYHENLGARLFNVSTMLSNLLRAPDGKQTLLHLVNYSGYPVENVTIHLLGKFKSAELLAPGAPPKKLETFEVNEGSGTGVEIEKIGVLGTVVLDSAD